MHDKRLIWTYACLIFFIWLLLIIKFWDYNKSQLKTLSYIIIFVTAIILLSVSSRLVLLYPNLVSRVNIFLTIFIILMITTFLSIIYNNIKLSLTLLIITILIILLIIPTIYQLDKPSFIFFVLYIIMIVVMICWLNSIYRCEESRYPDDTTSFHFDNIPPL